MPDFMLLLRDENADYSGYSEKDYEKYFGEFVSWAEDLDSKGLLKATSPLKKGEGKTVRKRDNRLVLDGPYAEAKEAIVGYYLIEAKDYDEACKIAQDCPIVSPGGSVEVRETDLLPFRPKNF